jgi:hypothetical protein
MNAVQTRRAKPRVSWKALALSLLAAGGAVAGGRRIGNMPAVRNAVHARQLRSINQQKRSLNASFGVHGWRDTGFQVRQYNLNEKRNKLNRVYKYGKACAKKGSWRDPSCMVAMNKYEQRVAMNRNARLNAARLKARRG